MPSTIDSHHGETSHAAREIATRSVAAVGLAAIALVHLLDAPGKFQETPYMGWMYIGLMLSCLALAATLLHVHAREAFRSHSYVSPVATAVIAGAGVTGYDLALRFLAERLVRQI